MIKSNSRLLVVVVVGEAKENKDDDDDGWTLNLPHTHTAMYKNNNNKKRRRLCTVNKGRIFGRKREMELKTTRIYDVDFHSSFLRFYHYWGPMSNSLFHSLTAVLLTKWTFLVFCFLMILPLFKFSKLKIKNVDTTCSNNSRTVAKVRTE